MELDPECEVHRHSAAVGDDLDVPGRFALLHAELYGEAFGFERAGVFGRLPLLDLVCHGGRQVVETADDGVNLFGGTQNLLLFGDVFLHGCI